MVDDKYVNKFRAITGGEKRRGIRLENQFWSTLENLSVEQMRPLSDIVAEAEKEFPDSKNITSLLRVYALDRTASQLDDLRSKTNSKNIKRMVQACPSPTFILSTSKKLYAFNPAFVRYLQLRFARDDIQGLSNELRLQMDQKTDELIERLRTTENRYIQVGFAVGMDNRSMRGKINAVLAPSWQEDLIICYIID